MLPDVGETPEMAPTDVRVTVETTDPTPTRSETYDHCQHISTKSYH